MLEQIEEVYEIMKVQADLKKKKIVLVNELGGYDISIYNDKNRLSQILINLISNSMKFVSENTGVI